MQLPPIDLTTLHTRLSPFCAPHSNRESTLLTLLELLLSLTNAAAAAYWRVDLSQAELSPRIVSKQALQWYPDVEQRFKQAIAQAIAHDKLQGLPLDELKTIWLFATPVARGEQREGVALLLHLGQQPLEMFVVILQLVAAYASYDAATPLFQQQGIALLRNLLNSQDKNQAFQHLFQDLQTTYGCQRVLLGYKRGHHCQLLAISDLPVPKQTVELTQAITRLMDDVVQQQRPLSSWAEATLPPNVQTVLTLTHFAHGLSVPLLPAFPTGSTYVLILLWKQLPTQENLRGLMTLLPLLNGALDLWRQTGLTRWQRLRQQLWRYKISWLVLIAGLSALLAYPVTHTLHGKVTLQASVRRFVVAPFAGILKESTRKVGDLVAEGELLARLEDREIRLELATLNAERARILKQKDAYAAARETASVQIAQLEMERVEGQIATLQYRLDNLELKSPLEGMVLSGDWQRAQGSPVTQGQSLFEVAPLDNMRVEIAIHAEDIAYVHPQQTFFMQIDAYPQQTWTLTLEQIQPKAVIQDAKNVFIGESTLIDTEQKMRPGMRGQAQIQGDKRALGWVLFHKVWETVWRWLQ